MMRVDATTATDLLLIAIGHRTTARVGSVSPITGFPVCGACGRQATSNEELRRDWRALAGVIAAPGGKRVFQAFACSIAHLLTALAAADEKGWPAGVMVCPPETPAPAAAPGS